MSPEKSPVAMKDIKWLTQNCTVGFLVAGTYYFFKTIIHYKHFFFIIFIIYFKGIWNNRYYSTTGSLMTTCNRSTQQEMLATGDADGYLRLFRYYI